MPLKVWLIRHGESTSNKGLVDAKPHQVLLTDKGRQQALAAANLITVQPTLLIVSPAIRAFESASYIIDKWTSLPVQIQPIQEYVYLSPHEFQHKSLEERRDAIDQFWKACDVQYHAEETESFTDFVKRLETFYHFLITLNGFVVVVGHGQFFKAFLLGLKDGFLPSQAWMKKFRKFEINHPMKNGEIIELYKNEKGELVAEYFDDE